MSKKITTKDEIEILKKQVKKLESIINNKTWVCYPSSTSYPGYYPYYCPCCGRKLGSDNITVTY